MNRVENIERLEKIHRDELNSKDKRIEQEKRRMRNLQSHIDLRIDRLERLLEESTEDCHQGLKARINELRRIKRISEHPLLPMSPPKASFPVVLEVE